MGICPVLGSSVIRAAWLNVAETVLTVRLFQEGNIAPNFG